MISMPLYEMLPIINWWAYFFAIGLLFFPLAAYLFPKFQDKGYIFSKTIGIILLSYSIFLLGSFHIAAFNRINIFLILFSWGMLIYLVFLKKIIIQRLKKKLAGGRQGLRLIILEEAIFLFAMISFSLVRSYQPDIYGIEKFMDFGFINSILRGENFPAVDPWFSGNSINYYYFGHVYSAVLIKLSNIPSNISFNLMLASVFALIFTSAFSLFLTLFSFFTKSLKFLSQRLKIKFLLSAILASFLLTISGNLQVIYSFFKTSGDKIVPFWKLDLSILTFPNSYWYPSATRFVQNAIHEFPAYALVLSDLHAHLLNTPFTILTIAFLFSIFLKYYPKLSGAIRTNESEWMFERSVNAASSLASEGGLRNDNFLPLNKFDAVFLSLLLSVLFMVNAMDVAIFFGLSIVLLIFILIKGRKDPRFIIFSLGKLTLFTFFATVLFSLPFSLHFKPFVGGIGINCSPEILTNIGRVGPILFERNYCQITPLWQLALLYGFFVFFAVSFLIFLKNLKRKRESDFFALILFIAGFILISIPEVIYLKDIYPSHFRANTMFKLSYSAFVILSIASGYALFRILASFELKIGKVKAFIVSILFISFALFLIFISSLYPVLAINSSYNFTSFIGLDGTKYLNLKDPDDYEAIKWINENIKGQEVLLEAPGDSYSDFGRISSYTGLPTVINWSAHEWLWRGSYEATLPRLSDVKTIYETSSIYLTIKLLKKYKISYVYIGRLEGQKYPNLKASKFDKLGNVIYSNNNSKIYKISQ